MIRNLFAAALFAALAAGLLTAAIQHFRVTPLILHAETFEGEGGHSHGEAAVVAGHEHAAGTAEHSHAAVEEWAPQDGFERTAYTALATILAAAGFALVIGAVSMFANIPITFANGLFWGAAGFITFSLAPAYGLAPELPGMPAADLFARQLWWVGTAIATGAAFVLLAKTRASWAIAVAVALIVAPHIIGAPIAPDEPSAVPAHLATEFAAITLGTSAVFWAVLGAVFGRLNDLFAARAATPIGAIA
ncbi:cobalt transporter subunit CbtA (proposed) [Devosia sp. LC5]|uniref:CbtA family protein n=1 Tax=Devosia sp. LC5 TaxID=1502724 RepID=UPI0004E3FA2A|nr:CbtA family protein [Devosia sp. LC5]KFC65107.1 cobalt transporter subunit CbtA (proposed) [Devosia sp. LC5]